MIEREEREGRVIGGVGDDGSELNRQRELQQRMDIDDSDIVIQGSTTTRISRKQVSRMISTIFFLQLLLFCTFRVFSFFSLYFMFFNFINFFMSYLLLYRTFLHTLKLNK